MASKRKPSRREFLKGDAALDALQDLQVGGQFGEPESSTTGNQLPIRRTDYLLQIGRRAMACQFHVYCQPDRFPGAVEAANEALDLVDVLENQMTVYREQSEIMQINRRAHDQACTVEHQLFELLQQCVAWQADTDGAFDITAGPLVKLWGFFKRQGRMPAREEIDATLGKVGSQFLALDADRSTIRFGRPGMEINLGSVGKGYALDRCAALLRDAGVEAFMVHGGQSSILARGYRHESEEADECIPWTVALRHPLRQDRRLAELIVDDRAIGTSGSGQQFFYHRGRRYGHVLDPRTGVPAEGVLSATVLARSAAEADAMATTFFVMGVEPTRAFCEHHPELSVVFVLPGKRQGAVSLEMINADDFVRVLDDA